MTQHRVDYLTAHQGRILGIIRRHITDTGEAPTVAEIRAETGRSAGGVHYQLRELEAKGAIVREPRRSRGIRLT
jgi:SOS-response transcriptional repressor LexA